MRLDASDTMAKVWPFFSTINQKCLEYENLNVDESMLPYYGRHSSKQQIVGKPIRMGIRCGSLHPVMVMWCSLNHVRMPRGAVQPEAHQLLGVSANRLCSTYWKNCLEKWHIMCPWTTFYNIQAHGSPVKAQHQGHWSYQKQQASQVWHCFPKGTRSRPGARFTNDLRTNSGHILR